MHITVQYNNLFLSENAHFIHAKLIIQKMDVNELAHVPNACNDVQKVYCARKMFTFFTNKFVDFCQFVGAIGAYFLRVKNSSKFVFLGRKTDSQHCPADILTAPTLCHLHLYDIISTEGKDNTDSAAPTMPLTSALQRSGFCPHYGRSCH